MDLTNDIQQQIKNHLPAQVGDMLRSELDALKVAREDVTRLMAEIQSDQTRRAELKKQVDDLTKVVAQHDEISKRLLELNAKEVRQELNDLKLAQAELRIKDLKEITQTVFRSPVFTQSVSGSVPVPVAGGTNMNGFVSTYPFNMTTQSTV